MELINVIFKDYTPLVKEAIKHGLRIKDCVYYHVGYEILTDKERSERLKALKKKKKTAQEKKILLNEIVSLETAKVIHANFQYLAIPPALTSLLTERGEHVILFNKEHLWARSTIVPLERDRIANKLIEEMEERGANLIKLKIGITDFGIQIKESPLGKLYPWDKHNAWIDPYNPQEPICLENPNLFKVDRYGRVHELICKESDIKEVITILLKKLHEFYVQKAQPTLDLIAKLGELIKKESNTEKDDTTE